MYEVFFLYQIVLYYYIKSMPFNEGFPKKIYEGYPHSDVECVLKAVAWVYLLYLGTKHLIVGLRFIIYCRIFIHGLVRGNEKEGKFPSKKL